MTNEAAPRAWARCVVGLVLGFVVFTAAACVEERAGDAAPPVYRGEVAPLLERRCVGCHGETSPQGGWRATSYLDAVACVGTSSAPATAPPDEAAPVLRALDSESHRGVVASEERAVLDAWVRAGTPAFRGTVHAAGIVDPRSPDWHGQWLRTRQWRPMLDANDAEACGRCHAGAPSRPAKVELSAPGATPCTSCHTEPQGVLACSTCHGDEKRAYPPRDLCFFPNDGAKAGAHAAHVEASSLRAEPLACSTCHPVPGPDVIGGVHGNGSVEVKFDAAAVGPEASYDRTTGQCSVSCHHRGGAREKPTWSETGKMKCGDCHASPPADHFPGPCSKCHREANDDGTSLLAASLHLNGKIDLGDGSGTCGACHGRGDDPWPVTGAHRSHENPGLAAPTDCATCHAVPPSIFATGHMNGVVEVTLSGRALDRGSLARWDGQSCTSVACHGNALVDPPRATPTWNDTTGAARQCGACHGIPPTQHTASTSCDRSTCHGDEVIRSLADLGISETGKALHVNGAIDVARP